jgi:hypothetical protein
MKPFCHSNWPFCPIEKGAFAREEISRVPRSLKKTSEFPLHHLLPLIRKEMANNDKELYVESFKITRPLDDRGFQALCDPAFWAVVREVFTTDDNDFYRAGGMLMLAMTEKMENFEPDPPFLVSVLAFFYGADAQFAAPE